MGYRKIQFATTGTLLGRKINLQNKTNDAARARLGKAKGRGGFADIEYFQAQKSKNRTDSIYGTPQ